MGIDPGLFHFGRCGECTKDKQIVCREKGKKITAINKERRSILKIQVDSCLAIAGERCDWLLIDPEANAAHFIELKGCEIDKGFSQLGHSITVISNPAQGFIDRGFSKKYAYLVLSHCPINSAELQNKKKTFLKNFKTRLEVKNRELQIDFNDYARPG